MQYSLFHRTDATVLCLLLFASCIIMVMLGHRLRIRFLKPDEPESRGGVNSLLGALFGLWGFLLAFTFANSSARFDSVRNIMVDETNSIRNVILRSKVFPDSISQSYHSDLEKYLQSRVDYYDYATNTEKLMQAKAATITTGYALWERTMQISILPNMTMPAANMFAALTGMFDVATKRDALLQAGIPEAVQYLLFFLALVISFIGGFTTPDIKQKEWIVISGFAMLACIIIYISLDLSRPMRGFIRPESSAQRIEELNKILQ